MLKKDLFEDKDGCMKKVTDTIKSQVESQGATFNSELQDGDELKIWIT
jgi:hypothetical protein